MHNTRPVVALALVLTLSAAPKTRADEPATPAPVTDQAPVEATEGMPLLVLGPQATLAFPQMHAGLGLLVNFHKAKLLNVHANATYGASFAADDMAFGPMGELFVGYPLADWTEDLSITDLLKEVKAEDQSGVEAGLVLYERTTKQSRVHVGNAFMFEFGALRSTLGIERRATAASTTSGPKEGFPITTLAAGMRFLRGGFGVGRSVWLDWGVHVLFLGLGAPESSATAAYKMTSLFGTDYDFSVGSVGFQMSMISKGWANDLFSLGWSAGYLPAGGRFTLSASVVVPFQVL